MARLRNSLVAEKNHRHSVNNPYAQFQDKYTLKQILSSKEICNPLTVSLSLTHTHHIFSRLLSLLQKLQCSPTSDGAGAAILANGEFVKENKLEDKCVEETRKGWRLGLVYIIQRRERSDRS